jgi:ligand-binding SRPBCC domain-containing protein
MTVLRLSRLIHAPLEIVFDLSRSIDLHTRSMSSTKEQAVAGVCSGCIDLHGQVTWKAWHLGKTRFFTSVITGMERPFSFTDEMLKGDFKTWKHLHTFSTLPEGTRMDDEIYYEVPYGLIGKLANIVFLEKYLRKLLEQRNNTIQQIAETDEWKKFLS